MNPARIYSFIPCRFYRFLEIFRLLKTDSTKFNVKRKRFVGAFAAIFLQKKMAWHGLGNVNSLLQQMQDIEVSLSNLMMETVLKMQTLMSTKVFLVLEDPTTKSRRYCGNKELISAYERSNFKASASSSTNGDGGEKEQDLEVRLDPNVDLLTTRPVGRKRRANADGDGRMASIDDNRTPSPPKRITRGSEEGDESLLDEEGDEDGYNVMVISII